MARRKDMTWSLKEIIKSETMIICYLEADDGHSNSYFFRTPSHILKIPIKIQLMSFNFLFLIPFLVHAAFLIFIRLFFLLNKTWSASTTICLLESSISEMFPVGFGFLILVVYYKSVIYGNRGFHVCIVI